MTVYLCGFMGCGKTTVGKILAAKLGSRYTDMDSYIVQCEKMSIPAIFREKGEEYFRDRETAAIGELGDIGGVIACGGGAMLREKNALLAAEHGCVVLIDTPFDVCYERIRNDEGRPLVVSNTRASLETLYNERKALYTAHSQYTADGTASPAQIADEIASYIKIKYKG
ncbi:MAG: shikimate kinase [Oscillospiraceae bacterium]|nr:shikimate kinase [Oscillospiraceae bacterium]